MTSEIKIGALIWPQYTEWQPLQDAAARADELGFDSLWTWDHLYPIVGDWRGPIFEGYLTLAGWAQVTKRATLGLMVGANTFRNPALVVKTATTLDHASGGRAVLGIGGAWFEREHAAYGIDFGTGFGERLDRLDEAVELMRRMLDEQSASARGDHYHAQDVRNDPRPVQDRLPILIGGGGEQKTLKTVAKYADAWNIGGDLERVRHKDEVLRRWCEKVGRDHRQIERTLRGGSVIVRNSRAEAKRVAAEIGRHNGDWKGPENVGTADDIVAKFAPYLELGFRHIYFDVPAPFDMETLERLATEVRPRLEQEARRQRPAA
ncbi:MAG TPA: TIGR03560 family F420-dependent LLM class oxidoreductase [Candidatus Caenarcaniphilales bacterium]|nr:TIGR03560 family F420-dependent LLM class oxidoreductase [Candidatus Caenarcaniphilales bacterium]